MKKLDWFQTPTWLLFNIDLGHQLAGWVNASFHISNRPWIPCDAYTK